MENGENGVPGVNAVKHVKEENRLVLVNATHQSPSMVEKTAKGSQRKQDLVTIKSLANVRKKSIQRQ